MQLFPSVSIFLPFPNGSPQSPAISLPFSLTFLLPKHPHLSNSLPLLNRHRHSHSLVQARSPNRWPPWTPRRRLQLSISRPSLRLRPPYSLTSVRPKLNSTLFDLLTLQSNLITVWLLFCRFFRWNAGTGSLRSSRFEEVVAGSWFWPNG